MIQQQSSIIKNRLTKLTIVEVVAQLLGSSSEILFPLSGWVFSTSPFLRDAVRILTVVIVTTSRTGVCAPLFSDNIETLSPLIELLVTWIVSSSLL